MQNVALPLPLPAAPLPLPHPGTAAGDSAADYGALMTALLAGETPVPSAPVSAPPTATPTPPEEDEPVQGEGPCPAALVAEAVFTPPLAPVTPATAPLAVEPPPTAASTAAPEATSAPASTSGPAPTFASSPHAVLLPVDSTSGPQRPATFPDNFAPAGATARTASATLSPETTPPVVTPERQATPGGEAKPRAAARDEMSAQAHRNRKQTKWGPEPRSERPVSPVLNPVAPESPIVGHPIWQPDLPVTVFPGNPLTLDPTTVAHPPLEPTPAGAQEESVAAPGASPAEDSIPATPAATVSRAQITAAPEQVSPPPAGITDPVATAAPVAAPAPIAAPDPDQVSPTRAREPRTAFPIEMSGPRLRPTEETPVPVELTSGAAPAVEAHPEPQQLDIEPAQATLLEAAPGPPEAVGTAEGPRSGELHPEPVPAIEPSPQPALAEDGSNARASDEDRSEARGGEPGAAPGEPVMPPQPRLAEPQHTSRPETAARPELPVTRGELAVRIAELARPEQPRMEVRLRLDPASLGEVRVQIDARGDSVDVRIVAATPEAREALADSRSQLRQELERQGLSLGQFNVSADAGRGERHQTAQHFPTFRGRETAASVMQPLPAPVASPGSQRGLDTRA